MKKLLLAVGFLLLAACAPKEADFQSRVVPMTLDEIRAASEVNIAESESMVAPQAPLPTQINLDVPFFPQAPDADWGMPWQEACEEASIILAADFMQGKELTKDSFRAEILSLVDWENENFGDYRHITIEQTATMLEKYFGFTDYSILHDPSAEDFKRALADGAIIVAPFAGKLLGNPFYSGDGPNYHMMVIKGYDGKNFITNDVGTRRGHNFIFKYDRLMSSLHDWNSGDIKKGAKNAILLRRSEYKAAQ
jgi:hypothetical protein